MDLKDVNDYVRAGGDIPRWDDIPPPGGNGAGQAAGLDWEPPAVFGRVEVPPFPVEVLPSWLAAYVEAVSTFTQTPPDLAAMLALAALSAAARGRWEIEVPTGHREPLCLYLAVALPPGERKSSVFLAMTGPIHKWERAEVERVKPLIQEELEKRGIFAKRLEQLRAKAAKCDNPAERANWTNEVTEMAREISTWPALGLPRVLADDVTPEALSQLLADQEGRLALLSAEGGLFDVVAGLYSEGKSNIDVLLKAHDAEPIRVDRKSKPPIYVPRAVLTLGLAVQPEVLRGMAATPRFRGRGLVGRILFSLPTSKVGRRVVGAPPVSEAVAATYARLLTSLMPQEEPGEEPDLLTLTCSPGALARFRDFAAGLEPRLAPDGGDLASIGDWAGKLAGALSRIAGLLHLAEHLKRAAWEPVNEATMARAMALGPYLIAHALAAFSLMGADPEVEGARRVLRWVEQTGAKSFTARDAFNGLQGTFKKMDALTPALRLLEEHGYIRPAEQEPPRKGPGRPGSPRYQVNPLWRPDGEVAP